MTITDISFHQLFDTWGGEELSIHSIQHNSKFFADFMWFYGMVILRIFLLALFESFAILPLASRTRQEIKLLSENCSCSMWVQYERKHNYCTSLSCQCIDICLSFTKTKWFPLMPHKVPPLCIPGGTNSEIYHWQPLVLSIVNVCARDVFEKCVYRVWAVCTVFEQCVLCLCRSVCVWKPLVIQQAEYKIRLSNGRCIWI